MAKLGEAFLSIFLDKNARAAIKQRTAARPQAPQTPLTAPPAAPPTAPQETHPAEPAHPTPEEIHARLEAAAREVGRPKTSAREELIREALRTRAEKAKMLDDLPEEARLKLQVMAVKSFMRGGDK